MLFLTVRTPWGSSPCKAVASRYSSWAEGEGKAPVAQVTLRAKDRGTRGTSPLHYLSPWTLRSQPWDPTRDLTPYQKDLLQCGKPPSETLLKGAIQS